MRTLRNYIYHCPESYLRLLWLISLAMIATAFGLWQWFTPLQIDDLAFQAYFNYFADKAGGHTFGAWLDYSMWYRGDTNGRLANYLAPVATLFLPRWLFAILTGIAVAWIVAATVGLSQQGSNKNPRFTLWLTWIFWPGVLTLWPWRDDLTLPDYALNYIFATAVDLAYLIAWLRAIDRRMPSWWLIWALPAALAGGMMHEGLALPMLGACVIIAITRKMRIPPMAWVLLTVFLAGTLESALSPGIWERARQQSSAFTILGNLTIAVKHCTLLVLLTTICLCMSFTRRRRRNLLAIMRRPAFAICALNALGGALICFLFDYAAPRYGWVSQIYSTICLGMLLHEQRHTPSLRAWALALTLYTATWILYGGIISWQKDVYDEDKALRAELYTVPSGTVYHDVITKKGMPLWLLRLPTAGFWGSAFQHACFNLRYRHGNKPFAVLPEAMDGFISTDSIPGSARMTLWNGYYVGAERPKTLPGREFREYLFSVTDSSGKTTQVITQGWPFTARDGNIYMFYGRISWMPENAVRIDLAE